VVAANFLSTISAALEGETATVGSLTPFWWPMSSSAQQRYARR
jgi:hypothetical protein